MECFVGLPTIFHIFAHTVPVEGRSRAFGYLVALGSVGQTVAAVVSFRIKCQSIKVFIAPFGGIGRQHDSSSHSGITHNKLLLFAIVFILYMSSLYNVVFWWSRDMEDHSDHHQGIQTFVIICLKRFLGVWWPLKPSVMNSCGNIHFRCQCKRRTDRDVGGWRWI